MRLIDRLLSPTPGTARHSTPTINDYVTYLGAQYPLTLTPSTTLPPQRQQQVAVAFAAFAEKLFKANAVVFSLVHKRIQSFSAVRFQYQRLEGGRPGRMWGDPSLDVLNEPPGSTTTQDLLRLTLLTADLAGSCYFARVDDDLVWLRPDWVDVVWEPHPSGYGIRTAGYRYHPEGRSGQARPLPLTVDQVADFAPIPDPTRPWAGMSWLTPVLREIAGDNAARDHKLRFFENAATPNLAVSLKESVSKEEFAEFIAAMDQAHVGVDNAYKTLYLGGGADVTVIGSDLKQLDFKTTQGHGETRLCMAAGVPPTVANSTEGMQGSSLNAGNFGQARRQFADMTLHPLWQDCAGTFANVVPPPPGSRLWYDARDVPLLREDAKDVAEIQSLQAAAIRQLVDAGYDPASAVDAVVGDDMTLLDHSGMYSVQLQPPGLTTDDEGGHGED